MKKLIYPFVASDAIKIYWLKVLILLPMLFSMACSEERDGCESKTVPMFDYDGRVIELSANGEIYTTLQSREWEWPDYFVDGKLTPEPAVFQVDDWGEVCFFDYEKMPERQGDEVYIVELDHPNGIGVNKEEHTFTYKWLTIKFCGAYQIFYTESNPDPEPRSIFMAYKPYYGAYTYYYYYNNFIEIRQAGCEPAPAE